MTDSAGNRLSSLDTVANPALLIDKAHLPRDLSRLDALPTGTPILVRVEKTVFKLEKQNSWILKVGRAGVAVTDYAGLQKAIWHFNSPWANGPIRVLGLKDRPTHSLALSKGVKASTLRDLPHQLRGQTVALSGPIKNGNITVAGEKFSLGQLRNQAEKYDLSLIILESRGQLSSMQLSRRIALMATDSTSQNTGQFLNSILDNRSDVVYSISPAGKYQVLISQRTAPTVLDSAEAAVSGTGIAVHVAIRAAIIFRPNESRQRELDLRLFPWLPSLVGIYLVISIIVGLLGYRYCNRFLNKLWAPTVREEHKHAVLYYLLNLFRQALLVLLIIPLLGLPLALYRLLALLVRAVIWVFNLLAILIVVLLKSLKILKTNQG